ncbi:MAG TPA: DDE-type integrase/transposase/recombinase [Candidatus Merdivicinus intestinavium]|nr:DDE-type integrase/transposase/recombinase [Candidatus Merdivicinus intestinavium]
MFDLSIAAYKTSALQSIKLVLDTVRLAMEKEEVTADLQLHSEQGFQYASQSHFTLTQEYGIAPSMSRRANPYDNAMAENFFSILKSECSRLYKPENLHDAQILIDEYITFYNHDCIQLNSTLSTIEKRHLFT